MMVVGHEMELAALDARVASVRANTELAKSDRSEQADVPAPSGRARELQVKQARQPVGSR